MDKNLTKNHRRDNNLYIVQAAVEYLIALLMMGSFLAALTTRLGMSDALTGILSSVISLGCVFQLLSLLVRARRSRRFVTVFSVLDQLCFAALYFIPFLGVSGRARIVLFITLILLAYFLYYIAHPEKVSWLMHWVDDGVRGVFTANMQLISLLTGMAFSLAMGALVDHFRAQAAEDTAFFVCGLTILCLTLIHTGLLRSITDRELPARQSAGVLCRLGAVLRNRKVRQVTCLYMLWNAANYAALPFYGTYQIKELGFSLTLVSVLSILGCFARALVSRAWGSYGDKRSFPVMVRLSFLMAAAAFFICAFAAPGRGLVPFALYQVIYCVSLGGIEIAKNNLIFDVVAEEQRSDALALNQSVCGLAGFLSTVCCSAVVGAVQRSGNMVLGLPLYAQQLMSGIAGVISLAAAAYVGVVLLKKEQ